MTTPIPAKWTCISRSPLLQRSSICASTIKNNLYIFGGELHPRIPRDNDLQKLTLHPQNGTALLETLPATSASPSPRVGAASAVVGGKLYMFSGRGGEAMAPVEERGGVWCFDGGRWELLEGGGGEGGVPVARSYHCMAGDEGRGVVYVHAGCPEKGRVGDFWEFDVGRREWRELKGAPGPARGGASIAVAEGRVWRVNGFDGSQEVGGVIDVYDVEEGEWSSIEYAADGKSGPEARSVGTLVPVTRDGETLLVTYYGEGTPSNLGHQGAGKMFTDGWVFSTSQRKWAKIEAEGGPEARGWFDADATTVGGQNGVVVAGGLGESNERLDDVWLLSF